MFFSTQYTRDKWKLFSERYYDDLNNDMWMYIELIDLLMERIKELLHGYTLIGSYELDMVYEFSKFYEDFSKFDFKNPNMSELRILPFRLHEFLCEREDYIMYLSITEDEVRKGEKLEEKIVELLSKDNQCVTGATDLLAINHYLIDHNKKIDPALRVAFKKVYDLLNKHYRQLVNKSKDMNYMLRLLNDEYVWYRDSRWKAKMAEYKEYFSIAEDLKDFCIDEIFVYKGKLKKLNYSCWCNISDVDYIKFIQSEFDDMGFRYFSMNNIYDYFDCILTIEFLEKTKNGEQYVNHDLVEIEEQSKSVEVTSGYIVEFDILKELVTCLAPMLCKGYTVEKVCGILEKVLFDNGRENECWYFLTNGTKKVKRLSVLRVWNMIGFMISREVLMDGEQKEYKKLADNSRLKDGAVESSINTNLTRGKILDGVKGDGEYEKGVMKFVERFDKLIKWDN